MIKSYIKEVVARLKGDEAEVLAQKNYRKAVAAVNSQLSALRAKLIDDEINFETASEELKNAKYPTTPITDNNAYLSSIVAAQNKLDDADATLLDTRFAIETWEGVLEEFESESEE